MANKETILIADDSVTVQESLSRRLLQEGHELADMALSVDDVKKLVDSGANFTLAIIDGTMSQVGDGKEAAEYIRKHKPGVKIISFSSDEQTFGDFNFPKSTPPSVILETIKSL